MDFVNGSKALVVLGRTKRFCYNAFEVYDFLIENGIVWKLAFNARAWVQTADIGETYNENGFDIYIE